MLIKERMKRNENRERKVEKEKWEDEKRKIERARKREK